MLDFRMDTFLAVCKQLNFTQAAKELSITQPAVSQHIKYLETVYQTKLFYFEGKKLFLTEAGKLLFDTVSVMKADENKLKIKMLQNNKDILHLQFGATLTIGEFVLPNKICQLLQADPHLQLTMIVDNTASLLNKLILGKIDFALLEGYFPKKDFDYVKYSREKFICIAGSDYSFKKQPEILEDLLNEPLIIREDGSGTREILERNLENQSLTLTDFSQVTKIGNIAAIKELIQHNLGITALYEVAVKKELEQGRVKKIEIADLQKYHDFYFVWRKNSVFSQEYQKIIQQF